jgi:hypothetical protein
MHEYVHRSSTRSALQGCAPRRRPTGWPGRRFAGRGVSLATTVVASPKASVATWPTCVPHEHGHHAQALAASQGQGKRKSTSSRPPN